ncbi:MAG TPA: alpha/beta fold hydrolase [Perlabentimonas sp.]|nr:alpha/beta fold hydrolase [Bacteroidales bacterium]MDD4671923.1 alpha/beta fold hydrolase [Bacteroidales bacterium]MDY0348542.1 alpha/beta fold hydrolase [Tenuifilaceae bacterium]HZJ74937.1 alpha/beta fold hydrolase [Perlabentimonas sp.]
MKRLTIVLLAALVSFSLFGQDITGQWNGALKVQGMQLRLVLHVTQTDDGYTATLDSPDQGATGIPVTGITFENPNIKFTVTNIGVEYNGELQGDEIAGVFNQFGQEFPLNLSRQAIEKEVLKRPQEPTKPYPYYTEDVTFQNAEASISLSATLTLPKTEGKYPVVILISGSGPQDRDEEIVGHKPFLVIADYLTRNGIGVLRYDDRGFGQSTGDFSTATSADFATDVESAIAYLKTRREVDKKKIGLVGHSEGGIIAPMVAAKSDDVSFIVLLAGTGIRGDKLLLLQQELIARASHVPEFEILKAKLMNTKLYEMVIECNDTSKLRADLISQMGEMLDNTARGMIPNGITKEDYISLQVKQIVSPWMLYFMKYDPAPTLEKVKCPVLAVNGEKDLQVPPKENLTAIKNALTKGGNMNVTAIEFPNLNHLFQECETGSPVEYSIIEQTFSPVALSEITKWIKTQTE